MSSFNLQFVAGFLRFQKWFDVDVSGCQVKHWCRHLDIFATFYNNWEKFYSIFWSHCQCRHGTSIFTLFQMLAGSILPTLCDQSRAAFAQVIFDAFNVNNIWQEGTKIWCSVQNYNLIYAIKFHQKCWWNRTASFALFTLCWHLCTSY